MSTLENIKACKYANLVSYGTTEAQHKLYRQESQKIRDRFRSDLEADYGLKGHPKADLLWSLAWGRGHGEGYYQVYLEYDELSGLVRA
jgi:hypothetical protein